MGSETAQCNQFYGSSEQANQIAYYHQQQQQQQQQPQTPQQGETRDKGASSSNLEPPMQQQQQQHNSWQQQQPSQAQQHEQQPTASEGRWQGNPYHRFYEAQYANQGQSQQPHYHATKRIYYQDWWFDDYPLCSPVKMGKSSGKTSNSKDICGDDKHKEDGDPWNVEAQAAFLGPNLWDKTLPYDTDLKVHQYADLDEFLSENGIPVDGLPGSHLGHSTSSLSGHRSDSLSHCTSLGLGIGQVTTKRERSPSPDCMSPDTMNPPSPADSTFSMSSSRDFDPRTRAFSDEELKPQPMIKKSRKQFVPDEMKDDKYWARRRKNNMAAKRSRDARRMKENQIALRAGFLEKENMNLHREVEQLKQENMELRARLAKYQDV